MADHHAEDALVGPGGALDSAVERGRAHVGLGGGGHIVGVAVDELSVALAAHGKHALEDGQQRVLVHAVPVLSHLHGHVVHEVRAGDVGGKVLLLPRLHAAHDHHGLGVGAGGDGGEVGLAIVVEGFAVDEAEHGNGNVVAARVIAQQRAQGAAGAQHAGFEQLVLLDAGHALQILAEHLGVEGLGIELRHAMSLLSMGR